MARARSKSPEIRWNDLRICLLTTQELDADPFPDDDWPCDPRPFLPEATWHVEALTGRDMSVARVTELIGEGFDVYFNLCDGAADERSPGIEVVQTLEAHGVPFTGATSAFYEPTRAHVKRVCRRLGIAAPRGRTVRTDEEIAQAAEALTFPLFVKHYSSYASVDLSRSSRVVTPAGLRRQARKMIARHGAALVEEYVDGIECTVLVAENPDDPQHPTTYQPMQYRFPPGEAFKHADMKWIEYDDMACVPVQEPELDAALRDVAARLFVGLDGASFGRCDIRVDPDGVPFVLEINANCGVYYPPEDAGGADLCLLHDPGGHRAFTRQLVRAAFARARR